MADKRTFIINEIRRLAAENGGQAPGHRAFLVQTGIREGEWLGTYWARWGDALIEAGFPPNEMQGRADRAELLKRLMTAVRHYNRVPTKAELMLFRSQDPTFPNSKTFYANFGGKEGVTRAIRACLAEEGDASGLLEALPPDDEAPAKEHQRPIQPVEGWVYLLRSGKHFKIGRSEELEKRVKQVSVALPESITLEHAIRTDDPVGIEAYWHRRFANQRANGEWFALTPFDISAFKKRKFQ